MFRGQFIHNIDAKGRVSMPARFREVLTRAGDERFVISPAPLDPCLHLYPLGAWEALEEKVSRLPKLDPQVVRFRRLYVSAAVECELDKAGRVLVPPHFREQAQLERELLWAGSLDHVELWAKDRWDAALRISPEDEAAYRAAVEKLQI